MLRKSALETVEGVMPMTALMDKYSAAYKAKEDMIFLTKLSRDLKKLDKVLWQSGFTKKDVDEVKEAVNTIQSKINTAIIMLDNFAREVFSEGFFVDKALERYVEELEKYIKFSNEILTSVRERIKPALYPRMVKVGDSIVIDIVDADRLLNLAILETVDEMIKRGVVNESGLTHTGRGD